MTGVGVTLAQGKTVGFGVRVLAGSGYGLFPQYPRVYPCHSLVLRLAQRSDPHLILVNLALLITGFYMRFLEAIVFFKHN